jgi:hypothetical protein
MLHVESVAWLYAEEAIQDTHFSSSLQEKAEFHVDFTFFLYLCTEMEKSDKIINIILALVALGLLALCIASVVR